MCDLDIKLHSLMKKKTQWKILMKIVKLENPVSITHHISSLENVVKSFIKSHTICWRTLHAMSFGMSNSIRCLTFMATLDRMGGDRDSVIWLGQKP